MSHPRLRRPSPAFVVAVVALIVALGGTSYAAFSVPKSSVGTRQLKNAAVTTKKLRNGAVTGSKLARDAVTGNKINLGTLGTVPSATTASSATNASNASALGGVGAGSFAPVAYAHVLADGAVDASQSKGINQSDVAFRGVSAYCFSKLPFTPKAGSVAIDYGNDGNGFSELGQLQIAPPGTAATDCDPGESVEVATSSTSGTSAPEPFYIVLYG